MGLNLTNEVGRNELHVSCARGDVTMARFLLERGVDPSASDDFGYTPFHFAVLNDHYHVAATLMEFGAYTASPTKLPLLLKVDEAADATKIKQETGLHVRSVGSTANVRVAVIPPVTMPSNLAQLMGHDRLEGHVQAYINAWREAGWGPLFWAALNGSSIGMWRWLFRMTPEEAQ